MSRISHLLDRKPIIKRVVQTADGQGGFTESLKDIAQAKGRRQAARGSDREAAGREEAQVTHVWYFEFNTDVRPRDIIRDGDTDYEVIAIMPPSLDDHIKIQTKEFQRG